MKWKSKRNNSWTPEQVSQWEQVRAKGKPRYLLSQSIWFGLYWFVLFGMAQISQHGLEKALSSQFLVFHALWSLVMGFVFAQLNWSACEARYHEAIDPKGFDYLARQRIEKWEKIKAKGLARYILTRGSAFAIFMCGLKVVNVMEGNELGFETFWAGAIYVVICCVGGAVYACVLWHIGDEQYRKDYGAESKRAEPENTGGAAKV